MINKDDCIEELLEPLNDDTVRAVVHCTTPPNEHQLEGIKDFVCTQTGAKDAQVIIVEDKSLVGGFVIHTDGKEYDFSLKKKLDSIEEQVLKTARESLGNQEQVLTALHKNVEEFKCAQ